MRVKKIIKLPKCDICGEDAIYDVPTKEGPWANLCEDDYTNHASDTASSIGTRFELKELTKVVNIGKSVVGIEETAMVDIIMNDAMRDIRCPECGDSRTMEPDAQEFTCECGARVMCPTYY